MKNILLTGASRGLGLSICKNLLEQGYCVYAVSRRLSPDLKALSEKYPDTLFFRSADLSSPEDARRAVFSADFVSNKIPLSGFVSNAAIAYDDLITNIDAEKLRNQFEVNVVSPMLLVKYAIRNMIYNRIGGSIVHISSISVHTGYKGLAMYAASKGAIEAFSKNTAREWGARGVRSNAIVAGFMQTDMSSSLSDEQRAKIFARTSQKKPTDVESVAKTAAFLLSDSANSITAQNIFVDGGTI